jgi:hypothetical protein
MPLPSISIISDVTKTFFGISFLMFKCIALSWFSLVNGSVECQIRVIKITIIPFFRSARTSGWSWACPKAGFCPETWRTTSGRWAKPALAAPAPRSTTTASASPVRRFRTCNAPNFFLAQPKNALINPHPQFGNQCKLLWEHARDVTFFTIFIVKVRNLILLQYYNFIALLNHRAKGQWFRFPRFLLHVVAQQVLIIYVVHYLPTLSLELPLSQF